MRALAWYLIIKERGRLYITVHGEVHGDSERCQQSVESRDVSTTKGATRDCRRNRHFLGGGLGILQDVRYEVDKAYDATLDAFTGVRKPRADA